MPGFVSTVLEFPLTGRPLTEPVFTDSKLLEEAYSGYEITDGRVDDTPDNN